ncbi:MAG: hypothetical protein GY754_11200 [bacterium]|nr:hypothetical protein [bacterium]
MAVTYFNIKTFADAVQDMLKKSNPGYENYFGSLDKKIQQQIIEGCYPYVKINDNDHFSLTS